MVHIKISYWDFSACFVFQKDLENVMASVSTGHVNGGSVLHLEINL